MTKECSAEIVYDPTNWIENAATAAQTLTIATQQAQQIAMDLANIKNFEASQGQWSNVSNELQQLGNIVQQGQAISYNMNNLDQAFQQKYQGYHPTQNYSQEYQSWSNTTLDTLRTILNSAGLQASFLSSEQSRLDQLKYLSQSSTGRMQAVQAGNMIATETVGQLQQLRQLVIAQTNAQNAYMAYQVQKDQTAQASADNWIQNAEVDWPGYRDKGYGANNLPHP